MIDRETVDRIYAAADIVEIVSDYVTLKRKGVNYTACCPFHNEKTPSFIVSPAKGLFKCFGCGKGGNAVTFVMEQEACSYVEALKMVAKRYHIEVHEREQTEEDIRRNNDRESMFALNGWAAEYFANYLCHEQEGMSVGMSYFRQQRKLSDATIRKFGLGFCPARGDRMTKDALAAGYKREFLLSTGLSLQRESDGSLYDRFRDRVIFPVHNISGRVVAFGGRTLRTDKQVAKYQNSPESEIYSKKRELYGLYFAKRAIQQQDVAILVEGYLDVISMHQAGVENVVASSGTSLTTDQIRLLGRFTRNITVIYDSDPAGIHASLRGIDMILHEGMNVRIVLLPDGDDPDTFARSRSTAEVQAYIRDHEQDFLDFKAHLLIADAQGDPIRKAALISDMVQSIAQIPDAIRRSVYIKECARTMDIDEQILIGEVARKRLSSTGDRETDEFVRRQTARRRDEQPPAAEPPAAYAEKVEAGSGVPTLERELAKDLLKYGHRSFDFKEGPNLVPCNVAEVIFGELDEDNLRFTDPRCDRILETYREQWHLLGTGVEVPVHHFLNHPDPEVCNLSVDLLTSDDNYVPSELWRRKEVHVESDEEMLAVGVPKAVTLYKSKVIERLIEAERVKLQNDSLPEEELLEIMKRLSHLNTIKVTIANKLQRLIL
ncbi:DNA primase [uncultured Alistipes sp.]|uniref:DNA primase n=1 Tax=uncultured Alistipes sp. TaxID=538949 RepID=UPI00260830F4|nr:DNA primase [uncultured Alistipes sp.]